MPPKKKIRNLKYKLEKELQRETSIILKLKKTNPELFRICEGKTCCQAIKHDGTPCTRPAVTDKTYIKRLRCCFLCWQHSLIYGVYLTYKVVKTLTEKDLSMDEWCRLYPEECMEYLNSIKS